MEREVIYIDDRSGSKELAVYVRHHKYVVKRMEYGDAAWIGWGPNGPVPVGVERKSIRDLVSSIASGRLSGHQLIGLMETYEYVYVLVEGIWKADNDGLLVMWRRGGWKPVEVGSRRFMAREVEKYLNTLQVACGVMVWRTESMEQSVRWMEEMYDWWQKEWNKHRSHQSFHQHRQVASLRKPKLVERMAKEIDGVGWEKARATGKVFGTVREMVNADVKEWMKVEGIGKKIAEKAVKSIRCK